MNKLKLGVLALLLCWGCADTPKDEAPWVELSDGTLNGWNQKGGKANYEVKEDAIVGSTVHDTPNSFLTTDRMYDDFILELDYKVDSTMNSGIQIRSNSFPHYQNGRAHCPSSAQYWQRPKGRHGDSLEKCQNLDGQSFKIQQRNALGPGRDQKSTDH